MGLIILSCPHHTQYGRICDLLFIDLCSYSFSSSHNRLKFVSINAVAEISAFACMFGMFKRDSSPHFAKA